MTTINHSGMICGAIILDVYIFPVTCKVPGADNKIRIQKKWSELMVHELPGKALLLR